VVVGLLPASSNARALIMRPVDSQSLAEQQGKYSGQGQQRPPTGHKKAAGVLRVRRSASVMRARADSPVCSKHVLFAAGVSTGTPGNKHARAHQEHHPRAIRTEQQSRVIDPCAPPPLPNAPQERRKGGCIHEISSACRV